MRPNSVATVAETLRLNGYSTGAAGKMHQMMENTVLNIKNRSHTIAAEVEINCGKAAAIQLCG